MADYLQMLALSPTMEKGTIASWQKQEGDSVTSGEVLCEVETDKATMEYQAMQEGTLLKILLPEGERAAVGDPIGIIGDEGEDVSDLVEQFEQGQDGSSNTSEENEEEEENEKEKENENEKSDESDTGQEEDEKTDSSADKSENDRKSSSDGDEEKQAKTKSDTSTSKTKAKSSAGGHVRSTPLARKIADENDLDIRTVEGTGPSGRIIKRDVEKALKEKSSRPAASAAPGAKDETVKLSEKRRVIAERLSDSFFTAPHYYLKLTVEVDGLLAARERANASGESRIGLNAFLIKFAAEALKRHPNVNASWSDDAIVRHGSIDVGLAVALENGLVTPVVRDCGAKTVRQIDAELRDLVEKAKAGKLESDDYTGNTFTITNLGSFGIEEFTAIINPPASAILAIGKTVREPVVDDEGELRVAQRMKLTLGCDHRVIDGAVGAAFLADLQGIFEDPFRAFI